MDGPDSSYKHVLPNKLTSLYVKLYIDFTQLILLFTKTSLIELTNLAS